MWPSEGSQIAEPWSSLIRGDERSYLPNLVIPLHELSLLFSNFPNTTAYHWSDANLYLLLAVVLATRGDSKNLLWTSAPFSLTLHIPMIDNATAFQSQLKIFDWVQNNQAFFPFVHCSGPVRIQSHSNVGNESRWCKCSKN